MISSYPFMCSTKSWAEGGKGVGVLIMSPLPHLIWYFKFSGGSCDEFPFQEQEVECKSTCEGEAHSQLLYLPTSPALNYLTVTQGSTKDIGCCQCQSQPGLLKEILSQIHE